MRRAPIDGETNSTTLLPGILNRTVVAHVLEADRIDDINRYRYMDTDTHIMMYEDRNSADEAELVVSLRCYGDAAFSGLEAG